ncbi:MAG: SpoIVB peptidase S55 domain-containing protein, partial [candidate division WOR-3 bacterium]
QIFCAFDLINPGSVEKGMRGIALTTFEENKIDTIDVEILGIMSDYQLGRDVIIAKLEGKVVEEAGVLAGMSGSPVYIDGKLLGAIAYGWTFSKEPICGITPFSDMKKLGTEESIGSSSFKPIKPVLAVAGFSPFSISYLDSLPFDFTVSETVLGGKTGGVTRLEPGGVCGVTLVSGDGNVSAMGTITEVIGDTIFALGHSAYATGASVLPLCGGSVITYLPSLFKSFKFAAPGDVIGKVVFDGSSGIKAIIGAEPPMVVCKIKIGNLVKRYKVTKEKSIFTAIPPFLVFSNWIEEMGQYKNVTVGGEINVWTDKGILSFPLAISGESIQRDLYQWIKDPLTVLQENEFEDVEIDSISIDLSSENEIREYFVKDLRVQKNKFDPDEMIKLDVVLGRYRDNDTTVTLR